MHSVNTTNLARFASYLNGREQYVKINECADTLKQLQSAEYHKAQ